jgi:hypothetical protein
MNRARIDGRELEYEVRGAGAPVMLVHGSHIADAFAPLLVEPVLAERYQLIRYHRRGFAGSTHPDGPLSLAQQVLNHRAQLVRDNVVFGAGHKLASAGLALMILFAAVKMAVFLELWWSTPWARVPDDHGCRWPP